MRETFETNYFGVLRMIQASVPLMNENRYGRIVNITSGSCEGQAPQSS
ncbi:SDR family NAD(P)-dependent oxidoreductase [Paenibacillus sp. FJAT-26967]|nr:SDR family NAD(P)-dependent oxidoreductase [Paenibacillus sp. FJAT-26967]